MRRFQRFRCYYFSVVFFYCLLLVRFVKFVMLVRGSISEWAATLKQESENYINIFAPSLTQPREKISLNFARKSHEFNGGWLCFGFAGLVVLFWESFFFIFYFAFRTKLFTFFSVLFSNYVRNTLWGTLDEGFLKHFGWQNEHKVINWNSNLARISRCFAGREWFAEIICCRFRNDFEIGYNLSIYVKRLADFRLDLRATKLSFQYDEKNEF